MHVIRHAVLPLALALLGAIVAARLVPAEQSAVNEILASFPGADPIAHHLRPAIVGILCLLPAVAALVYTLSGTLDRYLARQFLGIFSLCFSAFLVIWMISNFQDNYTDLKRSGNVLKAGVIITSARLPDIILTFTPYALLLSLLFCLGKLSASREIVAMIQTGRGLARVTMPLLVAGLFSALFCLGLNYHWAPLATAKEERALDIMRGSETNAANFVMFRNPRSPRLWMVRSFPADWRSGAPLHGIRIATESASGHLASVLLARSATHDRATGTWSFHEASLRRVKPGEPPQYVHNLPNPYQVKTWRETPAEIIQPGLPAEQLGIPDLSSWLRLHGPAASVRSRANHLTQWHYRFAQPLACLIVVLLATPLGVVFTRQRAAGSVAVAIFLAIGLFFFSSICLNLGDSAHMPAVLAAWLPNIAFGLLALYLFQRRLAGRPIYQTIRRLLPTES